mgnify:CR=1 FL=1
MKKKQTPTKNIKETKVAGRPSQIAASSMTEKKKTRSRAVTLGKKEANSIRTKDQPRVETTSCSCFSKISQWARKLFDV